MSTRWVIAYVVVMTVGIAANVIVWTGLYRTMHQLEERLAK